MMMGMELREALGACTCRQLRTIACDTGTCLGYAASAKASMVAEIATQVESSPTMMEHIGEIIEGARA